MQLQLIPISTVAHIVFVNFWAINKLKQNTFINALIAINLSFESSISKLDFLIKLYKYSIVRLSDE